MLKLSKTRFEKIDVLNFMHEEGHTGMLSNAGVSRLKSNSFTSSLIAMLGMLLEKDTTLSNSNSWSPSSTVMLGMLSVRGKENNPVTSSSVAMVEIHSRDGARSTVVDSSLTSPSLTRGLISHVGKESRITAESEKHEPSRRRNRTVKSQITNHPN